MPKRRGRKPKEQKVQQVEVPKKRTRVHTAKNWGAGEAFKALQSGDKESRLDIGKRYPLFATASAEEIVEALDFITARKIEAILKGPLKEEEEKEKPKKQDKISRQSKKLKKQKEQEETEELEDEEEEEELDEDDLELDDDDLTDLEEDDDEEEEEEED